MDTDKNSPNVSEKTKVAILEDGRYERLGMQAELKNHENIEVMVATFDVEVFRKHIDREKPDVAFIDLRIQGDINAGVNEIRRLKKLCPEVKCIALTAFPELPNFLAAFDAGVEGFVRKDALNDQQPGLADLIRIVLAGGKYFDSELTAQMRPLLNMELVKKSNSNQIGIKPNPLTKREQQILKELWNSRSNSQIAAKLNITENTVKAHVKNICDKVGAKDRRMAVIIAVSKGWLNNSGSGDD